MDFGRFGSIGVQDLEVDRRHEGARRPAADNLVHAEPDRSDKRVLFRVIGEPFSSQRKHLQLKLVAGLVNLADNARKGEHGAVVSDQLADRRLTGNRSGYLRVDHGIRRHEFDLGGPQSRLIHRRRRGAILMIHGCGHCVRTGRRLHLEGVRRR